MHVDTIVKVALDTVTIYRDRPITDTVFVENKVARAKAYVSGSRIVIGLQGKVFDIPVKADIVKKEKTKEIKNDYKNNWRLCLIMIGLIGVFVSYVLHKKLKFK